MATGRRCATSDATYEPNARSTGMGSADTTAPLTLDVVIGISKAGVEQLGRALRVELAASGASAGVAYFGTVDTAMTHHTLDDDEFGRAADAMLPWPLNQRIRAADAALAVADGIARRAPRTIAPRVWEPYSLLRGVINVLMDQYLSTD